MEQSRLMNGQADNLKANMPPKRPTPRRIDHQQISNHDLGTCESSASTTKNLAGCIHGHLKKSGFKRIQDANSSVISG
jgi:hypothetical protein